MDRRPELTQALSFSMLFASMLFACDPAGATSVDASRQDGAGIDAAAIDAAVIDAVIDAAVIDAGVIDAALRADASAIGRDAGVCTPEACAAVLGIPPVPEYPCGHCWASCYDERTCGMLCFEAHTCIFTAGCGPMCEPLCDTTEDCLLDDLCVDGICVAPEGSGEPS